MSTTELLAIIALVVVGIAVVAAGILLRNRRTGKLRSRFGGAEYDRALGDGESRRKTEAELDKRTARVAAFHLQPLSPADRARFAESWGRIQTRFVDGPAGAVAEADQLLSDLMSTRGYPTSDFDQRAADISVDHPLVLEKYRAAHEIALRQANGQASTEDLRQAMIHYRTLFEELLGAPEAPVLKIAS